MDRHHLYDRRNLIRDRHARLEPAAMPRQRFHNTRFAAFSTMAAMGVLLEESKTIVGYSMLSTTADNYSHLAPAAFQEAADAMERALAG